MKSEIIVSDEQPPAVRLCGYHLSCMGVAVGYVKVSDGARIDACHLCLGRALQKGLDVELDSVVEAVKFAAAHPLEAAALREREEYTHALAFILGMPVKDAEPIIDALCKEYGDTMEGLRRRLLRGDSDVWRSVEAMKG